MMKRSLLIVSLAAACASPAKEDAKGQVDESGPPSTPTQIGKGDASQKLVAVDVQSAHPYTNNLTKTFTVPFSNLPSCAQNARLHFKVLRTEANYDFVEIPTTGESFDGIADDTWTEWFSLTATNAGKVKLSTDGSITRHGFEIDAVEWDGLPANCPLVRFPPCGTGTVDLAEVPGTCECPVAPQCEDIANVEVSHHLYRGFNNTTKTIAGDKAFYTRPGPADAPETSEWGTIDTARLATLVRRAVELGLVHGPGYIRPIDWSQYIGEDFTIKAGSLEVVFTANQGQQDADVQSLIDDFEALFSCESGGGLTCGAGYECEQNMCQEVQSCICPALYNPQCGIDGRTYSNACAAGCAQMSIAHAGECGITGDACGTIMGLGCLDGYKCRFGDSQFSYPYPDAGGTCVADNYCDAPVDCNGLPHIAVPGQWSCANKTCAWQAGVSWTTLNNFSTANPYTNNMSVWHQAYLPAGAQTMRLSTLRFATETNYDKLEVWSWKSGAWTKVRSYTGSLGPALADELPGQYHYLKFVSDSSVVKAGVSVDVQYR
jgi:Kazal-type serine protease inhibitor domain